LRVLAEELFDGFSLVSRQVVQHDVNLFTGRIPLHDAGGESRRNRHFV
jgi:hypothetical protein